MADSTDVIRERNRRKWRKVKAQIMEQYGGCCICCGETTLEFLTLDHRDGRGGAHRRNVSGVSTTEVSRPAPGGYNFYRQLLKRPENDPNLRILCWNCNSGRGKHGQCPHEKALTALLGRDIL